LADEKGPSAALPHSLALRRTIQVRLMPPNFGRLESGPF
jgi:hypothetical protein